MKRPTDDRTGYTTLLKRLQVRLGTDPIHVKGGRKGRRRQASRRRLDEAFRDFDASKPA